VESEEGDKPSLSPPGISTFPEAATIFDVEILSLDVLPDSMLPIKERLSVDQIRSQNIFYFFITFINIDWQLAEEQHGRVCI
jgi:hypothetical protein